MGRGTPRHYKVKRKDRAYWEPTATMKRHGFVSVPLGVDGPEAFKLAEEWNQRWDQSRTGKPYAPKADAGEHVPHELSEAAAVYKPATLGAGFREYRQTDEWRKKAPSTREEWYRAWRRIKPVFGDAKPSSIKLQAISAFRTMIETEISLREAHRVIKIWRALWKVIAAMGYCVRDADPSLGVRNSAAKGRSQTWTEGEVVRLAKRAWRMRYYGLAAAIGVAWDTQMSPGDVRALTASQMAKEGSGRLFFTDREKTGKPAGGALSARALALLAAYLKELGVELMNDAPIFRNRSGTPYKADRLGRDFAIIREAEFGPDESRMLGHDFRRSGAVEAIAGKAEPAALSHAMGNTLSASNTLFATYVPVNATTVLSVLEARKKGRTAMR
jgi:hypothetical protein